MPTDEHITLNLNRNDVGQILDGLYERKHTWRYTQEYLETGLAKEPYEIADCSSSSEAEKIADYYAEIIESIKSQIE